MSGTTDSEAKQAYVLKRDYIGSSRLNLQYYLWKDALQFNLHPDIPPPAAGARIADVATGTSIWLVDMARTLPATVQCDGLDISLDQCPPAPWLPANVKLQKWDMFSDPPEELVGQFDIVHVRLIMLVIKDNNPVPIIHNLWKLLKPGGYLQWDEVDAAAVYIEKIDPSVQSTAIETLFRTFAIPKGVRGSDDWKTDLTSTLNRHGFQNSKEFRYRDPPTMARYWHDLYMVAWEEFISRVVGHSGDTHKLMDQAMEEARGGAAVMMPKVVWVARKESSSSVVHADSDAQAEDNAWLQKGRAASSARKGLLPQMKGMFTWRRSRLATARA